MAHDILHAPQNSLPLLSLPYDAICTFVFADYRDFARFMYDPASKALAGDHENFMVEEDMRMMVGDEFVVVEGGRRVGGS